MAISVCRSLNPVLSSIIAYHQSNTTSVISETGSSYHSEAPGVTPDI